MTVTITYTDGRTQEAVVLVTDRLVNWKLPTNGQVRQVEINRDQAALAEFDAI